MRKSKGPPKVDLTVRDAMMAYTAVSARAVHLRLSWPSESKKYQELARKIEAKVRRYADLPG